MFKLLGVLVLPYTAYAVAAGEVYAKAGWRARRIARANSGAYFWAIVVIYACLGAALLTVF